MKYALLDSGGTIFQACNDDTVKELPAGAKALTDEQFADWPAYRFAGEQIVYSPVVVQPVLLPPIQQIRSIEQIPAVADAMQRASRLVALSYALDDLIRVAASKGQTVTRTQAHDWAMANDPNYRTLYEAEQAIKPLRVLV